jgi:Rod binding domain-containing protein
MMSITISSDLVLGVMRAASPSKRTAAEARLASPQLDANRKFEAVMLRSMAEEMLPKDTSSLYGAGTAGNIWRSLQADLMSQEMAKAGGIGIARMLAKAQDRLGVSADASSLNAIPLDAGSAESRSTHEWPYFESSGATANPS